MTTSTSVCSLLKDTSGATVNDTCSFHCSQYMGKPTLAPATGVTPEIPLNVQLHISLSLHTFHPSANALVRSMSVCSLGYTTAFSEYVFGECLGGQLLSHNISLPISAPMPRQIIVLVEKASGNALFPKACRTPS